MEAFFDGVLWGCGFAAVVIFLSLIVALVMLMFCNPKCPDWMKEGSRGTDGN